jgi:hypothetical protein
MRVILRFFKKIWFFSFLRRIFVASGFFNKKYLQILRWGINSREFTNYTYNLTDENMEYLAHTISVVTGIDSGVIRHYIQEAQEDSLLKETIIHATMNSPQKRYADAEVRFGRRLGWYAFTRVLKPKTVVETGVDKGLGSVLLCAALLRNKQEGFEGKYFGTDINPEAGYLLTGIYKEVGKILYGDSIISLSGLPEIIDLFINDSDHSADYEYREYMAIREKIHDKTIILGDNAHCTDKLAVFSKQINRNFLFFHEVPKDHWYPGAGIGISFKK